MRIKRIEIIGFKSFMDKTVLNIQEPVTGIVGPNGCGKSNVVDAIRWCMGEQSAKHLRGKSMDDVIFQGSDSREPSDMAEVSLTFENVGFHHHEGESNVEIDPETDALMSELTTEAAAAATEGAEGAAAVEADGVSDDDSSVDAADDGAPAAASPVVGDAPPLDALGQPIVSDESLLAGQKAAADAQKILDDGTAIDFSQYGEVTVTRRLFRDGTSAYLINRTPARLRDITDFFLGTGVGTKAYSIIEQGRVGAIVTAKPQDRRAFIEEAAGITKFKKKKVAAERKMDQTRQNLLRVTDVVGEIEKQLGSLRRQAQKAERYKQYKTEVKDIELWSASHRWLGLEIEERVVATALTAETAERDAHAGDVEIKEAALVARRAELSIEERRLSELTELVYDLENRIKLTESQIEFHAREARDLDERAKTAEMEIESLAREAVTAEEELAIAKERSGGVQGSRAELDDELAAAEERLTVARHAVDDAEADLNEVRREGAQAQADIARTENQRASLERRATELEHRLSRFREEEDELTPRHASAKRKVSELAERLGELRQTKLDLGERQESFAARLEELKITVRNDQSHMDQTRGELTRAKSRLDSLRAIQERYEGFARGTRAVMKHKDDAGLAGQVRGLLVDVLQAPEEFEAAVGAVLGDRLGAVLVESREAALAGVALLKDKTAGRSSFVGPRTGNAQPLRPVPAGLTGVQTLAPVVRAPTDLQPLLDELFGSVLIVDSLAQALEMWERGAAPGFVLVTRDGDLLDPSGVVTGGSKETSGADVLGQKREIRELDETCARLDQVLADATSVHAQTKQELTQVGAALDAIRQEKHDGEIELLALEKDLSREQAEMTRLAERKVHLDAELLEMRQALEDAISERGEGESDLARARATLEAAEMRLESLQEGVTVRRGSLEDAAEGVTTCKVRLAQLDAEVNAAKSQMQRLENRGRELAERKDRTVRLIQQSVERASGLKDDSAEKTESLSRLREERTVHATELAEGRLLYDRAAVELQTTEAEIRTRRQDADRRGKEAARLEMQLREMQSQRRHLEESTYERYRVTLLSQITDHHLRAPLSETDEARMKELRELIHRMGEINLTAIEEFDALQKRFDFLTQQKADLEGALDLLEKAIAKINKTSRKLFLETYEAINAKFKEVYPRLFRGGKAELRLVGQEDDILEAGVEIFAQPPGKKNVTVELLSGGEKALTAVSLIFAIFLIKPSPFCILDEVDAPLDDANVDRYNDLVREMTDKSQFIVITHNKRTMEIADQLYGVTMEEPGCSKLVSVNLKLYDGARFAA